jgi:hypothetical protein
LPINCGERSKLPNCEQKTPRVLIVGLGGIGSNLLDLVVPVFVKTNKSIEIYLMDSDVIDESNLGHQKFTLQEIGLNKVVALAQKFSLTKKVKLIPIVERLLDKNQLLDYDLIIVAVDNNLPRELVHESKSMWIDLRCQGDGWIIIDSDTDNTIIAKLPKQIQPTSCQLPGAIEIGNIEFGFAAVAAIGAQWLCQKIRILRGETSQTPKFAMGYLTYGQMQI